LPFLHFEWAADGLNSAFPIQKGKLVWGSAGSQSTTNMSFPWEIKKISLQKSFFYLILAKLHRSIPTSRQMRAILPAILNGI
jgi:hypothetical protein